MIAILAAIRDRNDQEVARVEAFREGTRVGIRVVRDKQTWGASFGQLDRGELRLMPDNRLYLETQQADGKHFAALEDLVCEISRGSLVLDYSPAGIEQGHQLKRQVARENDAYVPFAELLQVVRESASKN